MSDLAQRLSFVLADRYRIERPLGRGGMATVFLAEDLKHHRRVAIKVLDPEVAAAIGPERFLREIETVAKLTHPHILPLHDSGVADGLLFYVMPFVEGESLRERLAREKQLPLDDALRIAREVADALSYAHSHGVVHRDIKPENILLEEAHAVVADFGIARAVAAGAEKLTATGIAMGTPAYMSPEQAAGSRDLDGRSDLYSLGCVLYEMLAGQPPFTGPTAESLAHQHLNVTPRPVTELRPAVPAPVAAALQRALAKTPADRFNPVALFGEALGSTAIATATPMPAAPAPRRHRARWLVAAAATVIVLVAIAAWQRWGPFEEWRGRAANAPRARRDWILVADFDGPPEDPSMARTAREIVCAALDQSSVVASLPQDQIQAVLQQAGKPDTTRLTPQLARELAYRATVRVLLEGEIRHLGTHFASTLRATDVEQDRQIVSVSDVAHSEDALIPMFGRMARRIREKLGEHPQALQTTHPDDWAVATPSFEAYRRFTEATRLLYMGDYAGAFRLNREALAADPNFGAGWAGVALAYQVLGKQDSAIVAAQEALRHSETLSPAYRLVIEGRLAWWRGDLRGALEAFERVTRLYPGSAEAMFAWNHQAVLLSPQGRLDEALAAELRSEEGRIMTHTGRYNLASYLIALGRLPDARREMTQLQGAFRQATELQLALAEGDWPRAESLAIAYERDPRSSASLLVSAGGARATVAAVRGEIDAAQAHLRRADELEHARGRATMASRAGRSSVTLALASGRPVPRPEPWIERDTSTSAIITRGYLAAAAGDTSRARRLLSQLRTRSSVRLGTHGATPEFIEACIAAQARRWEDVLSLVAQPAREGADRGSLGIDRIGVAPERWLVARAYEQLGRSDSAAAFYARLLAPDNANRSLHSFARARLAVLHARMGHGPEARRQLEILEHDFTRPDPDVRRFLDEARAAVAGLRPAARRNG